MLTYREYLLSDTKEGLHKSLSALDIKISQRRRKGELVDILDNLFSENPFYIIDRLPKDEQDLLSRLIGCKESEYVVVPVSEQRLGLQIHHLVVTENVGDK